MVNSRVTLKEYCLRKLGKGDNNELLDVELSEGQIDDLIDDALQYFLKFHGEASTIEYLYVNIIDDNKSYVLPDSIANVMGLVKYADNNFYNLPFQFNNYSNTNYMIVDGVIDYAVYKSHQDMLSNYGYQIKYNFNRFNHTLTIAELPPDQSVMVFKVRKWIDVDEISEIYNDEWVKRYTTALFKYQQGINLSKYTGVPMVAGGELRGDGIREDGKEEKEKLEEELTEKYEIPIISIMI